MNEIIAQLNIPPSFIPDNPSKDDKSRLLKFARWINKQGGSWVSPKLRDYRSHLLNTMARSSASTHLSTVRQGLQRIADDRDFLYAVAASNAPDGTPLINLKPYVDEFATRLDIAIRSANVKRRKSQDRTDNAFVRLNPTQATALIHLPNRASLAGLRDAALIGLSLATGLRADELLSLEVANLRAISDGIEGIQVLNGKGDKDRIVPYGEQIAVLDLVQCWLDTTGIQDGIVFRAVSRYGNLRHDSLTVRAFEKRLNDYQVDGLKVTPHDLRRTYAKQQYDNGMDIVSIKANMGHENIETTLGYIGKTDMAKRMPVTAYRYL